MSRQLEQLSRELMELTAMIEQLKRDLEELQLVGNLRRFK